MKRKPWTYWLGVGVLWCYLLATAGYGFYRIVTEVES